MTVLLWALACAPEPAPTPAPTTPTAPRPSAWQADQAPVVSVRHDPEHGLVLHGAGGPLITGVTQHARYGAAEHHAPTAFVADETTSRSEVTLGPAVWTVRLTRGDTPGDPRVQLQVQIRYTEAVVVQRESLALELSSPATMPDRAYRPAQRTFNGPFDPQAVRLAPDAHLVARAPAVELTPTAVHLVLDDARLHPFETYRECGWEPRIEQDRVTRSAIRRQPGDTLSASATLLLADAPVPLIQRFPRGFDAALVFTDHADQASEARLRALMYDRGRGFAAQGLSMTKTVFASRKGGYRKMLDDPDFLTLTRQLVADGIEIGPHSVTGGRDDRDAITEGLTAFASIGGAPVWIDHQPDTNCEAITNRGWADGRWRSTDLLQKHGYRYVWANRDVAGDPINTFLPDQSGPAPVLYRHPLVDRGGKPLWLFTSMWRAKERAAFLADYHPDKLDRLQAQRGLHIAHTYLDTYNPEHPTFGAWSLLDAGRTGLTLADDVAALFAELSRRQEAGQLWVAGMAAVGDHMVAASQVEMAWAPDGVVLHSDVPVPGLTLDAPGLTAVDGQPVPATQREGDRVWFDLPAGATQLTFTRTVGRSHVLLTNPDAPTR